MGRGGWGETANRGTACASGGLTGVGNIHHWVHIPCGRTGMGKEYDGCGVRYKGIDGCIIPLSDPRHIVSADGKTLTGSIGCDCHCFVRDGKVEFLSDSKRHKGETIPLLHDIVGDEGGKDRGFNKLVETLSKPQNP